MGRFKENILTIIDDFREQLESFSTPYSLCISAVRIARALNAMGMKESAEKIIEEVKKRMKVVRDSYKLSQIFFELSLFYGDTGMPEKRKRYLKMALDESRKCGKISGSTLLERYAEKLFETGDQELAVEIAKNIPDENIRRTTLYGFFISGLRTPETEKAAGEMEREIRKGDSLKLRYTVEHRMDPELLSAEPEDYVYSILEISRGLLRRGEKKKASEILEDAIGAVEDIQDPDLRSMLLMDIARLKNEASENVDGILEEVFRIRVSSIVHLDNLLSAAEIFRKRGENQRVREMIYMAFEESLQEQDPFLGISMLGKIARKTAELNMPDVAIEAVEHMLHLLEKLESRWQKEDAILNLSEVIQIIATLTAIDP